MAHDVQLATRIPKPLHREVKLYCVTNDVSLMDFVVQALTEKLQRKPGAKPARPAARA